ncbi:MAG: SBBP repeat-containing protein, partial [Bacteroidia bacterium]|nr:SBBP repeat-containing protein [Bacteroidia bacterium]
MKKIMVFFTFSWFLIHPSENVFIPNKGQWPNEVLYLFRAKGMNAFITKNGIVFDFLKFNPFQSEKPEKYRKPQYQGQVVKMEFLSAMNAKIRPKLSGKEVDLNFINERGNFNIRNCYEELIFENFYRSIDLRFYAHEGWLRFDFIVHPGANPFDIHFKIEGSDFEVNSGQSLVLNTSPGKVKIMDLKVFQGTNVIPSGFKKTNNVVSFNIFGAYRKDLPIIIDPLVWSTFIGGASDEGAYNIVRDNSGNLYTCGYTQSVAFPTVTGSYDNSHNGGTDGFISKLNSAGSSLLYSTFIGGSGSDYVYWLKVNNNGEVYACGETNSSNFPTTAGAFSTSLAGGSDGFVLKLNNSGGSLIYSTLLGGSAFDAAYAIDLDTLGHAYVCGSTASNNFPTLSAFDNSHNGFNDAFIAKLNPNGSGLIFSTFFGGSGTDDAYTLKINSNNEIVFAGYTESANIPTTNAVYDPTYNGSGDAFVSALTPTGNALAFSTYLGGLGEDCIYGLDFDGFNNIYVTGYTNSGSYPTTSGVIDNSFNGGYDIVISKLNAFVALLTASSFFGGASSDYGYAIDVINNASSDVVITGYVASTTMSTTANAYDNSYNGGTYDAFVLRTNNTYSSMIYSSYIGGSGMDGGQSVTTDANGYAYLCGFASSTFPTTVGAFDFSFNGSNNDAFVLRICTGLTPVATAFPMNVCHTKTLTLSAQPSGLSTYTWSGPSSFTASGQNITYTNVPFGASGIYTLTVSDASGCKGTATTTSVTILPNPNTSVSITGNTLTA